MEKEITFRRHTAHLNLYLFLEPIPNRESLKEMTSLITFSVFSQPTSFCMTVWPIPTGIIALLCWYLSSTPHWRSGPLVRLYVLGKLDLGRLMAQMYLSQELGCHRACQFFLLVAVGSFKKYSLDWHLLCWLFSALGTSRVLEGVGWNWTKLRWVRDPNVKLGILILWPVKVGLFW